MAPKIEWFDTWFSSPYYHILYKNRDFKEAKDFLDNLSGFLDIKPTDYILDLACGRGRHSIYLNKKGFNVVGVDLSGENISEARKFENQKLKFFTHDMIDIFKKDSFDFIFNFFTSFGYFDTEEENEQVVRSAAEGLKMNGKMIIDFLNPYTVIHNLAPEEIKKSNGITFQITKKIENGYIIKHIDFEDNGNPYHFTEKVKAIRRTEFLSYFKKCGLELLNIFGDYNLNPYVAEKSERMIFILKKNMQK